VRQEVTGVSLYRSHLGRGPARYEALARWPLAAADLSPPSEEDP
jgi:hypothetical protein